MTNMTNMRNMTNGGGDAFDSNAGYNAAALSWPRR
jgi:hypothetical protein